MFRYTIRALLIVVTCFCLALGVWTYRARRQQSAVERINAESTNRAFYDYQCGEEAGDVYFFAESPLPAWLVKPLGEDFFHSITEVHANDCISGCSFFDEVAKLPTVKRVYLSGAMTDADLECLRHLHSLEHVDIGPDYGSQITDRTLILLGSLSRLKHIRIDRGQFTEDGLRDLCTARALQFIWLEGFEETNDPKSLAEICMAAGIDEFELRRHDGHVFVASDPYSLDKVGLKANKEAENGRTE